jgi:hypothetical protein
LPPCGLRTYFGNSFVQYKPMSIYLGVRGSRLERKRGARWQ